MNLTLRQVAWAAGMAVGFFIGMYVTPAWEMAPFLMGPLAAVLAGITAQCAVYRTAGQVVSIVLAFAGAGAFALHAKTIGAAGGITDQCVGILLLAGLSGAAVGSLIGRKTR